MLTSSKITMAVAILLTFVVVGFIFMHIFMRGSMHERCLTGGCERSSAVGYFVASR